MCIRIKVIEFLAILIMITVDIDDVFLCAIQYASYISVITTMLIPVRMNNCFCNLIGI